MKVFSHTRMTAFFVLAALALLAFVAPSAMAESCNAPPGTSGIDQYCESIPSPGGNGGGKHHSSGAGGSKGSDRLPPGTAQKLQQTDAGQTVLALTKDSPLASSDTAAPAKKQLAKHHAKAKHHRSSSTSQTTPSNSTPAAAQDTTPAAKTSFGPGDSLSGSLGAGFLVLLIVIAGLFGFLAWLSRRDRREPQPD
jgi:hypothetical protein